jgi:hypothetical protein
MTGLLDTLMNLFVFAFVGLLIWLYFYEPKIEKKYREDKQRIIESKNM